MNEWRQLASMRIAGGDNKPASRVPYIAGGGIHAFEPREDRPDRCSRCNHSEDWTSRLDGPRVHYGAAEYAADVARIDAGLSDADAALAARWRRSFGLGED